jgi:AraC-like DNA-binding protein
MVKMTRPPAPSAPIADLPFAGYNQGHRSPGAFHVFRYEESLDPRQVRSNPHRHDFFQILWLDEGRGTLRCDLAAHAFSGPTLAFFAPGRLHAWDHEIEPRGILFGFPQSFFNADADYPGLIGRLPFLQEAERPLLSFSGKEAEDMARHFSQLLVEAARELPGRDDIVRAFITIILSKIRQHLHVHTQETRRAEPAAATLPQRFRIALDQKFPKLLKVSDYAKLLQVSRSHLNEELRRHTGRSASDHIHDRLLLEARRLLVYSPMTVAQIAYELQFQDPSYFGRFFRLRTGISPGTFRQQEQARLAQA